jgi:hypothetical protein
MLTDYQICLLVTKYNVYIIQSYCAKAHGYSRNRHFIPSGLLQKERRVLLLPKIDAGLERMAIGLLVVRIRQTSDQELVANL